MYSLLFDTGPDARAFERNYTSLDVAHLASVERVVLSHWHRDHSGGMLSLLKLLNAQNVPRPDEGGGLVTLDLHPDRPIARGLAPPPFDKVVCRLPDDPTFAELEAAGARLELRREGHVVGGGAAWVSGEIPRVTEFEGGLPGGMRWVEDEAGKGAWTPESVSGLRARAHFYLHSHRRCEAYYGRALCRRRCVGQGPRLVQCMLPRRDRECRQRCHHKVLQTHIHGPSRFLYPITSIIWKMSSQIIGGLHLAGSELESRIPQTVEFLSRQLRPAPTFVLPLHCSGFPAKVALEKALGEGCVPGGVGMKIDVKGDPEGEKYIFAARAS